MGATGVGGRVIGRAVVDADVGVAAASTSGAADFDRDRDRLLWLRGVPGPDIRWLSSFSSIWDVLFHS
jgi:hypothetical protein